VIGFTLRFSRECLKFVARTFPISPRVFQCAALSGMSLSIDADTFSGRGACSPSRTEQNKLEDIKVRGPRKKSSRASPTPRDRHVLERALSSECYMSMQEAAPSKNGVVRR